MDSTKPTAIISIAEMKHNHEYQATKIKPIIQIVAGLVGRNPELAKNNDYLWTQVVTTIPALADTARCGGCERSMKITVYEADLHDALLILAMARQVREAIYKGKPFTEANKVHIPTLAATNATLKRQTKCDYLCLIKQPEAWRGSGYWVLTRWAWQALRGEPIPRAAKYWEGHLLGRSETTTTLTQMFQTHTDLVERALLKRNAIKTDHRAKYADYQPREWAELSTQGIAFDTQLA